MRSRWRREARLAELRLAPPAGRDHLASPGLADDRRAVAQRGDHGAERPRRRPLEALQRLRHLLLVLRRPRHPARSARAAGGRTAHHRAVGQALHLRSAAAISFPDDQRHLQGRRERDRADEHQVSAGAPLRRRAAQVHRPEIPGHGRRPRDRQPGARSHFQIHGRGGLHLARRHPGAGPHQYAEEPGQQSQQAGATRGHGAAGSQALQRLSARGDPDPRHARAQHRAASGDRQRHQSADRAVLPHPGVQIPRRARSRGVEAQADRGQWHRRVPADGQQGHFGFLSALARHRGHSAAGAVAEFEDHHHRLGQGRPADHPQRRDCGAGSDAAVRRERHAAPAAPAAPTESAPGSPPGGSSEAAPPAKSSNVSMPPASDKIQAAQPSAAATPSGAPAAPAAPSRSEASAVESILSRINGALHGSAPPPATPGEESKH